MLGYILLTIALVGLSLLCLFFGTNRKKINDEIMITNADLQERFNDLEKSIVAQREELKHLQETKSLLMSDINNSQEISYNAFSRYQDSLEESYTSAENEYDRLIEKLEEAYNDQQKCFLENKEKQETTYKQEIDTLKQELKKLKETRAAALEAQRREDLIKLEKDNYRVILTQNELTTIEMINELKPRLPEPRILCMLVWQTFYQKKLTVLCKKILGPSPVCGIYKITNLKNDMCYIGQAKNVEDRFKEHMKCGLGIDTPVGNKLYQAMLADGAHNFTFELVQPCPPEQLNEKEKFYIDLYQSKDFGYNSTAGNK